MDMGASALDEHLGHRHGRTRCDAEMLGTGRSRRGILTVTDMVPAPTGEHARGGGWRRGGRCERLAQCSQLRAPTVACTPSKLPLPIGRHHQDSRARIVALLDTALAALLRSHTRRSNSPLPRRCIAASTACTLPVPCPVVTTLE